MAARTERLVVTGAAGFVGTWLLHQLQGAIKNREIEFVPLLSSSGKPNGQPDIRDADGVAAEIARVQPTAVIHLAAIAAPGDARADPRKAWEVNVIGTLNVAEAVRQHAPTARFIYVGSSEAYGSSFNGSSEPLTESAPLAPQTVYGATKAAADLMVGQMAVDGLKCVRFRPFNHTGPGQSATYVTSAFARQIARIERRLQPPVVQVGNLEAERDLIDVRDVVEGYIAAVRTQADLEPGIAFNLATGKPVPVRAILDELIARAAVPVEVALDPKRQRPQEIGRTSGKFELVEAQLGWRPRISFESTVHDVLEYWRSQYELGEAD